LTFKFTVVAVRYPPILSTIAISNQWDYVIDPCDQDETVPTITWL
jgi:hypothetical protein